MLALSNCPLEAHCYAACRSRPAEAGKGPACLMLAGLKEGARPFRNNRHHSSVLPLTRSGIPQFDIICNTTTIPSPGPAVQLCGKNKRVDARHTFHQTIALIRHPDRPSKPLHMRQESFRNSLRGAPLPRLQGLRSQQPAHSNQ